MTETSRIVQDRDDFWRDTERNHVPGRSSGDALCCASLHHGWGYSGVFWIALQAQFADVFDFSWIADDRCFCGKREAFDVEREKGVAADSDRYPRVAQDVGMFLRISRDEAVKKKTVIDVTDERRLRPAVGPVRGDCHHPMLIEQPKNEIFRFRPMIGSRGHRYSKASELSCTISVGEIDLDQTGSGASHIRRLCASDEGGLFEVGRKSGESLAMQ